MKQLLLFTICTLLGTLSWAQSLTVSGTVTDAEGEVLIGVNIFVSDDQTIGTITDIDGNYSIEVPDAQDSLIFSYTGYQSQTVPVNGQSEIDVVLLERSEILDEVVVIGYGTQRKSDLTGSVSKVEAEELQRIATGNVEQALQGRVAGVQVTPVSGEPGAGAVVRIRGTGTFGDASPLYVVDDMILNDISYLSPNSIESVEVLKDASATAIYGARGANGVIIITTKKGSEDGGTVISVDAFQGWQEVANRIDLVNAQQYATLTNELNVNQGGQERYPNPEEFGEGTDWQDVIFQTAPMQNVQVSANGGNENILFNVSFDYFNQEGIVRGSDFERYTLRLNNEYRIKDYLSIGHNLALLYTQREFAAGVTNTAYRSSPIATPFDSLGNFSPSTAEISSTGNPEASIFYQNNSNFAYRGVGNVYADLKFLENFTFRANLGIDLNNTQGKNFVPVFSVSPLQQNPDSDLSVSVNRSINWLWENTLTYSKEFENSRLNILGGVTAQEFMSENLTGRTTNLIGEDEDFFYINAGDESTASANNSGDTWTLLSYLFRTNYSLKNRYLFTVSFRADGSSKFGENKRFGYFPSAAVGWNVTNEPFMSGQGLFSRLKFRASWGQIGNEKIGTYLFTPVVNNNLSVIFGPVESLDNVQTGASVLSLPNPDLQWEETSQTDIGLEMGFFNNKLLAEIDYYTRTTDAILAAIPIPDYIGSQANPTVNAAKMRNQGIDLNLTWRETRGDFSYSVNFVGSTVDNEVLELGGGRAEIFSGGLGYGGWLGTRTVVGNPIGSFYGWQVAGVYQNEADLSNFPTRGTEGGPGDLRFEDVNGDGEINADDRTTLGNPIPDYIFGMSASVQYAGFDLVVDFNGQTGNEIFNAKKAARFGAYNYETTFLDRWTGEGTSNFEPRVTNSGHNYIPSDRFIEDGSYVRLRNLQFGYTLPNTLLESLNMRNVRVYISATNLITWTDYSGYTPEIVNLKVVDTGNQVGDPFSAGIDRGVYPISKVYNIGLNLSF